MSGHQNQRADHRRLPSDATSKELDPYHTAVDGQQPADSDLSQEGNKEANDINSPEAQHVLYGPAPEGGLRAWLAAAGGGAVYFATLGFSNSFGTFEEYYRSHQLSSSSASKISWIGSLAIFLQFFTGMLSGPLFDRYGQKVNQLAQTSQTQPAFPAIPVPFKAVSLTFVFFCVDDRSSSRLHSPTSSP